MRQPGPGALDLGAPPQPGEAEEPLVRQLYVPMDRNPHSASLPFELVGTTDQISGVRGNGLVITTLSGHGDKQFTSTRGAVHTQAATRGCRALVAVRCCCSLPRGYYY